MNSATGYKTLHLPRVALFTLLGLLDLFLTSHLLQFGGGQVYESNPIAGAFLRTYGLGGLVVFKLILTGLVDALAVVVAWHRPAFGGRILTFGCLATSGVVVYSVAIALVLP